MATQKKKDTTVTLVTDWTPWVHTKEVPEFVIIRKPLATALKEIQKAAAGKSTLPVLANVLIAAQDGKVRLTATNLEIGVVIELDADVKQAGAITLPAKLLADVVDGMIADEIHFTANAAKMEGTVKCGRQESTVKGIESDEFPTIPHTTNEHGMTFPGRDLFGVLKFTVIAAASDDSRPVLSGMSITLKPGEMRVSCADGFRMNSVVTNNPTEAALEIVVPANSVSFVLTAFTEKEDIRLEMAEGGSQLAFCQGNKRVVTRLIDGRFPDVVRIIPDRHLHEHRFKMNVDALKQELKVAKLAAEKSQNVLKFTVKPNVLILTANAAEVMGYAGELDIQTLQQNGEPMIKGGVSVHAVNVKYLEEALGVVNTKEVWFELQLSTSPVVIREVEGHEGSVQLIMPMSIR